MKVFWFGFLAGVVLMVILFSVFSGVRYFRNKDKELMEYVERQMEIEVLREDYSNRDPVEFLGVPGVRGAADGAAAEFDRRRDEAIYRFRSGYFDWRNFRCSVCGN